jgi:nicotinamide-nucleotide amidase
MQAEILAIGDELLAGETDDSNSSFISRTLAAEGITVVRRQTLGDRENEIADAIRSAASRVRLVIVTGGLGPTPADLTRQALAEASGRPLRRNKSAEEKLREYFALRGRVPAQNNFRQCEAPEGALLIENTCGTAPGIFLEWDQALVVALPGPPAEMREMLLRSVVPRLRQETETRAGQVRTLRLMGIGESNAAEAIDDLIDLTGEPSLAIYASTGEVRLRLSARGAGAAERLSALEKEIRNRLGDRIYGTDDETLESVVGQLLRARPATLSVAESCTGGLIADRITDVPGSSEYFVAGIVAYANAAKIRFLGVEERIIREHGAVSEECARSMAEGARARTGTDFALAVTGIAGPGGGTAEKPVGLAFLAVADSSGTVVEKHFWPGTRSQFKRRVSRFALDLLRRRLLGMEQRA